MNTSYEINPYQPPDLQQDSVNVQRPRKRPTDATGCFWMLLAGVAAFTSLAYLDRSVSGLGMLTFGTAIVSVFYAGFWQVRKWMFDYGVNRGASDWCRENYPEFDSALIGELIVAIAHCTGEKLTSLTPTTRLNLLIKTSRPWLWVENVFRNAGIRGITVTAIPRHMRQQYDGDAICFTTEVGPYIIETSEADIDLLVRIVAARGF